MRGGDLDGERTLSLPTAVVVDAVEVEVEVDVGWVLDSWRARMRGGERMLSAVVVDVVVEGWMLDSGCGDIYE